MPFDSAYKYMATFHHLPLDDGQAFVELVKGGPDVILDRCTRTVTSDGTLAPIDGVLEEILAANRHLSEQGLRVLAFAVRRLDGEEDAVRADPQSFVGDLAFAGMVGIIDPLRPEAVDAVATAHRAGIDVRMITGDHAITGAAIGAELGLGEGAISGPELARLSDDELRARLPDLHVFGRVTPEDKLRLARLMQQDGAVVAMTGDAVNDAAALKQADIGVAMGSGSEVTKQAAKMILTDDNFGTLVTAIRLGRSIYDKIVSYVNYQMTQLLSLVLLFLVASVAGIAGGAPLTPMMVLFINFFISIFPVIVIMRDPAPENLMDRPPRDPAVTISNPRAVRRWILHGLVQFAATLLPFLLPVAGSTDGLLRAATMAFVVMSLGTIASGLVMRRSTTSGLSGPVLDALGVLAIPVVLTLFAVELPFLQQLLGTVSLSQEQWLTSIGLALILPVVVELGKLSKTHRIVPTAL